MSLLTKLRCTLFGPKDIKTLNVYGMHCSHCKATVEKIARATKGIVWAEVDLSRGILSYEEEFPLDLKNLKAAISAEGFKCQ